MDRSLSQDEDTNTRDAHKEHELPYPDSRSHEARDAEVRYVLSGEPTGWTAMAAKVREFDEEKVKDTKEDIDTLLVFVSSFVYNASILTPSSLHPSLHALFPSSLSLSSSLAHLGHHRRVCSQQFSLPSSSNPIKTFSQIQLPRCSRHPRKRSQ